MRMLVTIVLEVLVAVGAAAVLLSLLGVPVRPLEPSLAGPTAALAAAIAATPMFWSTGKSMVAVLQFALASTVIHMMLTGLAAIALFASGAVSIRGPFVYWLIGAYWISLAALVWQLRKIIIARAQLAKSRG